VRDDGDPSGPLARIILEANRDLDRPLVRANVPQRLVHDVGPGTVDDLCGINPQLKDAADMLAHERQQHTLIVSQRELSLQAHGEPRRVRERTIEVRMAARRVAVKSDPYRVTFGKRCQASWLADHEGSRDSASSQGCGDIERVVNLDVGHPREFRPRDNGDSHTSVRVPAMKSVQWRQRDRRAPVTDARVEGFSR
jgi:hypothetical protein